MKKQWLIVAAIVGILVSGAILGLKLAPDIFPVEVGARAPSFTAVDLATGDTVTMDDLRGQVVLLNIWATWCAPCREEMPSMQRLHQELGPEGLRIIAVSIDEADSSAVTAFQREFRLTFPIWHDRSRAIERIYQTTGVPESFVVDRSGRIQKRVIGAAAWDAPVNKSLIRRLLAQRA
jgi:cytochrome c biogenesis protein CcmG, thiol:disulfide interchange protein DsbE